MAFIFLCSFGYITHQYHTLTIVYFYSTLIGLILRYDNMQVIHVYRCNRFQKSDVFLTFLTYQTQIFLLLHN